MSTLDQKKVYASILLHLIFAVVTSPCFAQLKVSLRNAVDSALKRNTQVKYALIDAAYSEENVNQSRYNLLPVITANPQSSLNWGRTLDVSTYNYINQRVLLISGGVNLQFTLFQGGLLRQQVIQNKLALSADKSNVEKIKSDLTLQVATTFLETIAGYDLSQIVEKQLGVAKLKVVNAEKGFKAGNKGLADVAQAKALEAGIEVDQTGIQNTIEAGLLTLEQLMEIPHQNIFLLKPDTGFIARFRSGIDTIGLWQQVKNKFPDFKLTRIKEEMALQSIKVVKSGLYPSITLFGSLGTNYSDARSLISNTSQISFDTIGFVDGTRQRVLSPAYRSTINKYPLLRQFSDNFYQSAGITLQIPLFNRFSGRINVKKAKLEYQKSLLASQSVSNNLYKIFNQSIADFNAAIKKLSANESNYLAKKQVLYVSEKRYQAGVQSAVDYYTALANFNKTEISVIQSQYEVLFKRKIIDYYMGEPLTLD